jgi:hypothetical protein
MRAQISSYNRLMAITSSRLAAIRAERTALLTLAQAGVFMGLSYVHVVNMCNRGALPLARSAEGELFILSRAVAAIEVDALRPALSPLQKDALERWLGGEFETPKAAVTAVNGKSSIAQRERRDERSGRTGAP